MYVCIYLLTQILHNTDFLEKLEPNSLYLLSNYLHTNKCIRMQPVVLNTYVSMYLLFNYVYIIWHTKKKIS